MSLFDTSSPLGSYGRRSTPIEPCDPHVDHPAERARLMGKAAQVLDLLRAGEQTNLELARAVGHRFGGRISDLRAAGYVIKCVEHNRATGHAVYRLVSEP
jgi:hypothetical protein